LTTRAEVPVILVGGRALTIEDVILLARGHAVPRLDGDPEVIRRIHATVDALDRRLEAGDTIYGVTTGFGESCGTSVPGTLAPELATNLVRFHGCGTGHALDDEAAAAVTVVRLATLARGYSGVREVLLERLCQLLQHRILPVIPEEGSVGASGDLTPLSYLAALVMGEREARLGGETLRSADALRRVGLEPFVLRPKESLALMNGTSVMAALACVAFDRATRIARAGATITAMMSDALQGEPGHFDQRIFAAKPHPGTALCARWIREHLEYDPACPPSGARVQDRYSIRCAPHVIGVLLDSLPSIRRSIEIEINGASDFYGGHMAYTMDCLKSSVANVADLLDRQIALACSPSTSHGLTANLVMRSGPDRVVHHGFKAMQISASALTAEALKLTMPASVFSRSTESHNQDKVSMGTIAARDALRVTELTERVTAITLLAACQAVQLRGPLACRPRSRQVLESVRRFVPANTGDRRQDHDIETIVARLDAQDLSLGVPEEP
jgi:histidine ammonia-lyase